jgi:hypothetical protein
MLWDFTIDTAHVYADYDHLGRAVLNLRSEVNALYEHQGSPNAYEWVDLRNRIDRLIGMVNQQPFSGETIRVYSRSIDWEKNLDYFKFVDGAKLSADRKLLRGLPHESDLRPHWLFAPTVWAHEHLVLLATGFAAAGRRWTTWLRKPNFYFSAVPAFRVFAGFISLIFAVGSTFFDASSPTSLHGYWVPESLTKVFSTRRQVGNSRRSPFGLNTAG